MRGLVRQEIARTESIIAASALNNDSVAAMKCAISFGTITLVTIFGGTTRTRRAGDGLGPIAGQPGEPSPAFFPWRWNEPATYSYGDNVYYEGDEVYYGDEAVASTDEYADQAQTLVASAPKVDEAVDWMSLGVFAVTQDGEESGAPPTFFVQLAVNKQGIIAGTFQNMATEQSQPVEGMIDQKSQRTAWTIEGKQWPIMETGISNLTEDAAPALVHFEDGQTQQWLLVRLEEPASEAGPN